jgi:hypothetical protein
MIGGYRVVLEKVVVGMKLHIMSQEVKLITDFIACDRETQKKQKESW